MTVSQQNQFTVLTKEQKTLLSSINQQEDDRLSEYAAKNIYAIREFSKTNDDAKLLLRTPFGLDIDTILHNIFYNRYADKTQVFSFYKNDDITRRALHVQLVSRISRIIGRALSLNLDLIEAISLGHDMGHTPFGHRGETFLSNLYYENTGKRFNHNVHCIRVLRDLTNKNLTLQTLDGILCHCGEKITSDYLEYHPNKLKDFKSFIKLYNDCYTNQDIIKTLRPSTLEGCVVRISDMIAYAGKDRQDSYKAGLRISQFRNNACANFLKSNNDLIDTLICNIVKNSIGKPFIKLDKEICDAFSNYKDENTKYIYNNKDVIKPYTIIEEMMSKLYYALRNDVKDNNINSYIHRHHINSKHGFLSDYYEKNRPIILDDDIVVDYIASMTDDYFIDLFKKMFPADCLNDKILYTPYFSE